MNLFWKKFLVVLLLAMTAASRTTEASEVGFVKKVYGAVSKMDLSRMTASSADFQTVQRIFDFKALFRRSTEDFWDRVPSEDYLTLEDYFCRMLAQHVTMNAREVHGQSLTAVRYQMGERAGSESIVILKGRAPKADVVIEFSVAGQGEDMRIVDVAVNGALLSRQYRGQFNRIFREEGTAGLRARMEKKITAMAVNSN